MSKAQTHTLRDFIPVTQLVATSTVLVANAGVTSVRRLTEAVERLDQVNAPLAGVVLNRAVVDAGYGYGYRYQQDGRGNPSPVTPAPAPTVPGPAPHAPS